MRLIASMNVAETTAPTLKRWLSRLFSASFMLANRCYLCPSILESIQADGAAEILGDLDLGLVQRDAG